jgi:hypothetical protein
MPENSDKTRIFSDIWHLLPREAPERVTCSEMTVHVAMVTRVLTAREDRQIFQAIVRPVMVEMMDGFVWLHAPTDLQLHDADVF